MHVILLIWGRAGKEVGSTAVVLLACGKIVIKKR